jgi:cytochrome c-type protein NapC
MEASPYQELQETIHWSNRTGVRATCPDCHVPRPWIHKIVRKIRASNELYHHFITKEIDTPEKYEEQRFKMAKNVWKAMKATDSRECRNCHAFQSMDFDKQQERSAERHFDVEDAMYKAEELRKEGKHEEAAKAGLTCIDCHKGIAHSLPAEYDPEKDIVGASPYYE